MLRSHRPRGLAAALALLASPALAQGPVIVVDDDGGPGVDHQLLDVAVAQAPDGAVILVKPGLYEKSIYVDGKSLTITADPAGEVRLDGRAFVMNLAPAQSVVIRGLRAEGVAPGSGSTGFALVSNEGPVVLQGCRAKNTDGSYSITAFLCDAVTLVDCDVEGGAVDPGFASAALSAELSHVTVYGSTLAGAPGKDGADAPPPESGGAGGHGVMLVGGSFLASGAALRGGPGGAGGSYVDAWGSTWCGLNGAGGDGIWMLSQDPQVHLLDCVVEGGAGGVGVPGCAPDGAPGAALAGTGTVSTYVGAARGLEPLPPLQLGQTATLTIDGEPGDLAFLAVSLSQGYALLPALYGTLVVGTPFTVVSAGAVPGSGTLQIPLVVPALGPPAEALVGQLQAGFLTPTGAFFLGAPSAAIALAPGL